MKTVWIVTHFCSDFESKGNNRFNYIAKMLADRGVNVKFFTSDFSHVKKRQRTADAADKSIHVSLIHEIGYKKNVSVKRIISHRKFGKNLAHAFSEENQKPDVVYLAVPSIDAGKVTADYCQKNSVPLIIDIQDLWPEAFAIALKKFGIPQCIFAPMKNKADYIYRSANKVIAVSDTYLDRAYTVRSDKNGLCVYIGTDLEVFDSYPEIDMQKPKDEVWITYIGTLGNSYDIDIVIEAIKKLCDKGMTGFRFKVFGDGPSTDSFKAHAAGLPIDFYGRVLYRDLIGYVRNCDIAVNPIVKGAAQSIINKHADYAAAGLPVINTQECEEYRNLINQYKCGINCDVESVQEVVEAIEKLINNEKLRKEMGVNSRRMAEEIFDRSHTYLKIIDEIQKVMVKK